MSTTDDLLSEWYRLRIRIAALEELLDPVERELLSRMRVGDELPVPRKKVKIKKCARSVLIPEILEERVSPELWAAITIPKPDAALMKIAKRRGVLRDSDLSAATKMSKPWLIIKN
jgi:hypothetical protein